MSENHDTNTAEEGADTAEMLEFLQAGKLVYARLGIDVTSLADADPAAILASLSAAADRYEALTTENYKLLADNERLAAAAKKASTTAKAEKRAAPKLRKVAPLKLKDGVSALTSAELHELIRDADEVEVVFSDGKSEIAGLDAIVVSGDAWRHGPFGLKLDLPELTVTGPARDAYEVDGYGLLIDGDLVAYHKRMDTLRIGANARVSLKDDVIFGG